MRWPLASTFAAMAMSGCYGPSTVACPDGVLCPADQACTGNPIGAMQPLCGNEHDVEECRDDPERSLCDKSTATAGVTIPGLCIERICNPCTSNDTECRFAEWTPMAVPTVLSLSGIHVVAADRAYAVGSNGIALTYNGKEWIDTIAGIDTTTSLTKVWPIAADVMVVGQDAIRSGQQPTDVPGTTTVNGLWGDGSSLLAVATNEVTGTYDGTTWTWDTPGIPLVIYNAVWGWSGGAAVAVGVDGNTAGVVRRRSAGSWVDLQPAPPSANAVFTGVWGVSENDFFVVGYHPGSTPPDGVVLHYTSNDGWRDMTPSGAVQLNAIWGSGPTLAYAVGSVGTILRFDGTAWSPMSHQNGALELQHISGIGSDAMVTTNAGEIWRIAP